MKPNNLPLMKHTYTLFYVEIIVLGVVVMLSLLLKPYV